MPPCQRQPEAGQRQPQERPPEPMRFFQQAALAGREARGDVGAGRRQQSHGALGQNAHAHAEPRHGGAPERGLVVIQKQQRQRCHGPAEQRAIHAGKADFVPEHVIGAERQHRGPRRARAGPARRQPRRGPQHEHAGQQPRQAHGNPADGHTGCVRNQIDGPKQIRRLVRVVFAAAKGHQPVLVLRHLAGDVGIAHFVGVPQVAAQRFAAPQQQRQQKKLPQSGGIHGVSRPGPGAGKSASDCGYTRIGPRPARW